LRVEATSVVCLKERSQMFKRSKSPAAAWPKASTYRSHRHHITSKLAGTVGAAATALVAASALASAAAAAPHPAATTMAATTTPAAATVGIMDGPYGPMLVAGSGPSPGTALYMITSDYGSALGCTTAKQEVAGSPYECTGPETGKSEWPAYTTNGTPQAGPGVKQSLLGEIARPGIGEQVTYDGHPLYLFDQIPGLPTGEAWDEPGLPADHGTWYLVSPSGNPMGWEGMLTTATVKGRAVLAELMLDGGGWVPFPVYSYSGGTACTGACAIQFNPVYAIGSPGLAPGLPSGHAGLVTRPDGTEQRTWYGKALYLYANETIQPSGSGLILGGNGNGVRVPGEGSFSLVSP
jgi:predicted lipoprotein with Yx(FWY)xxD motif